ncbi:DUF2321 domain-containing protein [Actinomadura sp. DSM 109109]|nr:DUF2321 domain-containing protein [Actinomadura lepetitiana]
MNGHFWRSGEPGKDRRSGYQAAIVCRRGHPIETRLTEDPGDDLGYCPDCGADILGRCAKCKIRIRGHRHMPGFYYGAYTPPPFCDGCGVPHPWASREDRIHELENLLDEEGIEEADRVIVLGHLEQLRDGDLDEQSQVQKWKEVKRKAPGLFIGTGQEVARTVISAAIRAQLGL